MKSKVEEISTDKRLPKEGHLVEVKCPSAGDGWFKARLIKAGKYPLWQCLDYPGTLGAVTMWRETT